ncbi:hypothetical protein [[Leptolyngbya] sp. PCC 7376]|uniref:hypothetical protein n=1 Tax=[Leptolyngbya] sp. PCC 7376 TaxID=111781 RepID=UPI00135B0890|nr:hypothetical protein [[Leptolyngbya] sp. PCC 7376]
MGIDIVYQATGYRTFINVVLTDDIDDQRFIETSCLLASTLKTDVAIGDLSDTNGFPGIFIKIDSSLQIQRGYERYDDNGNFDLDLVAIPMSLNDYLLMLSS